MRSGGRGNEKKTLRFPTEKRRTTGKTTPEQACGRDPVRKAKEGTEEHANLFQ